MSDTERIILEQLEEAELNALKIVQAIEDKKKIKNVFCVLQNAVLSQFVQTRTRNLPYYQNTTKKT